MMRLMIMIMMMMMMAVNPPEGWRPRPWGSHSTVYVIADMDESKALLFPKRIRNEVTTRNKHQQNSSTYSLTASIHCACGQVVGPGYTTESDMAITKKMVGVLGDLGMVRTYIYTYNCAQIRTSKCRCDAHTYTDPYVHVHKYVHIQTQVPDNDPLNPVV